MAQTKQEKSKEEKEQKIGNAEKEKESEETKQKNAGKKTETEGKDRKSKKQEDKKIKKSEAIVKKLNVGISTKHSIAICNFIRYKNVDKAIQELREVVEMKRAIPMKGELPHRKGRGMERGRYPIKAVKEFIKLLRQLSANSVVNGLDIDKAKIECKADKAARPYRRFGRARFKRTNILLKLKISNKISRKKKNGKK
jgi:large subunit ribosomal protein L22